MRTRSTLVIGLNPTLDYQRELHPLGVGSVAAQRALSGSRNAQHPQLLRHDESGTRPGPQEYPTLPSRSAIFAEQISDQFCCSTESFHDHERIGKAAVCPRVVIFSLGRRDIAAVHVRQFVDRTAQQCRRIVLQAGEFQRTILGLELASVVEPRQVRAPLHWTARYADASRSCVMSRKSPAMSR